MSRVTGTSKAMKTQASPSKDPEDQDFILDSWEMVTAISKFLESLDDRQWREVNEGVYNEDVKKKLENMCADVLKVTTDAVISAVYQPSCSHFITADVCCCGGLRQHFRDDIKNTFESSFLSALQEIGGRDVSMKISPVFSQTIESRVIREVCTILLDGDSSSEVVPHSEKVAKDKTVRKTLVGAISTMRAFLTCRATHIRKQIWKREMSEVKQDRKAKREMSLWKICVLRMHRRHVQSMSATDYERRYSSNSPTSWTAGSHGGSVRAAAEPEEDDLTSEQVGGSPAAPEKPSSTSTVTGNQVNPLETKRQSSEIPVSDAPKETPLWKKYLQPARRSRVQPVLTEDLYSFDSSSCGDWSTENTEDQKHDWCSLPITSDEDLESSHEITTTPVEPFIPPEEDTISDTLTLDDNVEKQSNQDRSVVEEPLTIEDISDSQEETTFTDSEDKLNKVTKTQRKKGFWGFLRRFFTKDRKKTVPAV